MCGVVLCYVVWLLVEGVVVGLVELLVGYVFVGLWFIDNVV